MGGVLSFVLGLIPWLAGQAGLLGALPKGVALGVQGLGAVLSVLGIRAAAGGAPQGVTDFLAHTGTGWKTALGAIVWLTGALLSPEVFATLPPWAAHTMQLVGGLLGAIGLYHAAAPATSRTEGVIAPRAVGLG